MADKPTLRIVTHEDDIDHPGSYRILDMLERDMPTAGRIRDETERKRIRRAVMRDFGRYLDMMLTGDAAQVTVVREAA